MKKISFRGRIIPKLFGGIALFFCVFFLGISSFASFDNIDSNQRNNEKQDISVFFYKLGERLQGVFKEIVSLSLDQNFFGENIQSDNQKEEQKALIDIDSHLYQNEILQLAKIGVIDINREKFYPDNYLRRYELVIMMVKYNLAKSKSQLSPVVMPLRGWFFDVAQNSSYAPYVAYAEQEGLIDKLIVYEDDNKKFFPNKKLTRYEVCDLLELDITHKFCDNEYTKRGEFSAVLLRGFRDFQDVVEEVSVDKNESKNSFVDNIKVLFTLASSR